MSRFHKEIFEKVKNKKLSKVEALTLIKEYNKKTSSLKEEIPPPNIHKYTIPFDGKEFFLTDHIISGRAILPGVVYLEMAYSAFVDQLKDYKNLNQYSITLKDVYWLKSFEFIDNSKELKLELDFSDEKRASFEIFSEVDSSKSIYCIGKIALEPRQQLPTYNVSTLIDHSLNKITSMQCYSSLKKMGILYGPSFQYVEEIYQGNESVIAKITRPSSIKGNSEYDLHPALLDASFHASIGFLTDHEHSSGTIAFAMDEMVINNNITDNLWSLIRKIQDVKQDNTIVKFDVEIMDEKGDVAIRVKGFSSKKINNLIPIRDQNQDSTSLTGNIVLLPLWDAIEVPEIPNEQSKKSHLLVVGGSHFDRFSLIKNPSCQDCLIDDSDDLETAVDRLPPKKNWDQIVWICKQKNTQKINIDTLEDENLFQLFRDIKTLLKKGYGTRNLEWIIITKQAQAVQSNDSLHTVDSTIHGFVGTLSKEYPNWKIKLIDSERDVEIPWVDIFKLNSDPLGNAKIFRKGVWYQQNFIQYKINANTSTPYRNGGVYVIIGGAGGLGELWTEFMIVNYNAQVIWIGRRDINHEIQSKIDRLSKLGPKPLYLIADAADEQLIQKAYHEIKNSYKQINGVIHSAVGQMDLSLANMEESYFRNGLKSKLEGSLTVTEVFGNEPLDFLLFFSSMASFTKDHGKSSYCSGCLFQDSLAYELAQKKTYPVKVINWGYWGDVGIGAIIPQSFKNRLSKSGIVAIDVEHAMQTLQFFIKSDFEQLIYFKTTQPFSINDIIVKESLHSVINKSTLTNQFPKLLKQPIDIKIYACDAKIKEMEKLLKQLLYVQLKDLRAFVKNSDLDKKIKKEIHRRWVNESIRFLEKERLLSKTKLIDTNEVWSRWEAKGKEWINDVEIKSHFRLVDITLRSLPNILLGKEMATNVMFPNGSMEMVEGVYKNNLIADYFNKGIATLVTEHIRDLKEKIRILEIGAGTGGTTSLVLPELAKYKDKILEYCFSDISKAFLINAENTYGQQYNFLTYKLFDVSQSPASQEMSPGTFDIVIATNVLHATKNIRQSIRNVKNVLKKDGLIILNEINKNSIFTHLTFGLLDGWWLYEDPSIRIPCCPGLSSDSWNIVLQEEGFHQIIFPLNDAQTLGQQIVVGQSNGLVREMLYYKNKKISKNPQEDISIKFSPQPREISNELRERSVNYFKKLLSNTIRIPLAKINSSEPLESYGIDSILIVQLTSAIKDKLENVSNTLFFEYQTIDKIVDHLIATQAEGMYKLVGLSISENEKTIEIEKKQDVINDKKIPETHSKDNEQDNLIAIIGMSGKFPQSKNLDEYWENLKNGNDCITEIPSERWSLDNFYDSDKQSAILSGKSYSKWGGFVEDFANFDSLFFNISPKEAMNMNPQERIFIECAWSALEDAGYTKKLLAKKCNNNVGVFAGITRMGYELYGPEIWKKGGLQFPHTSFSSLPNRVSYLLNLNGPSLPVDTMCSSSLTAVHEACEYLIRKECRMALVGGVNLYLHPANYVALCALQMLSKYGHCRSFGKDSDGIVLGEGVGVIVLKPLSEALKDNDNILAVIHSTGINHGGKTNGYTVPNPIAQGDLIRKVLDKGNISAKSISYVEAHGTGTELGDPIELSGLTEAYRQDTNERNYCSLGSVKSNIGHLESAAGIAGIIKIVLQLQNKQIVPTLHAKDINPNIDFSRTPFYLQQQLSVWRTPLVEKNGGSVNEARLAAISSFGAGGSNAHVILGEHISSESNKEFNSSNHVILLSAKNKEALKDQAKNLLLKIKSENYDDSKLLSISYTLQVGREAMEERIGFVVKNISELTNSLQLILSDFENVASEFYVGSVRNKTQIVTIFENDSELLQVIHKWLNNKNYSKLLELWVNGVNIDWEEFYGNDLPKRMSLPTYPFTKERYWIKDILDKPKDNIGSAETTLRTFEEYWEPIQLVPAKKINNIVCLGLNENRKELVLRQLKVLAPECIFNFASDENELKLISRKVKIDSIWYFGALENSDLRKEYGHLVELLKSIHRLGISGTLLIPFEGDPLEMCYGLSWIGFEKSIGLVFQNLKISMIYDWGKIDLSEWISRLWIVVRLEKIESLKYKKGQAHRLSLKPYNVKTMPSLLRKNATYIITGGCGGLGLLFAEYITKKVFKVNLILCGRSPLDGKKNKSIKELEALGASVLYLQADVSDAQQMKDGIHKAKSQFGEINGVLHLAGLQGRNNLLEKEFSEFEEIIAPKIQGTQILDELLNGDSLEFVCYFSSAAAILGDFGSCDYAVGNRFQMAYSEFRKTTKKACKTVVINWPLWKEGGMGFADDHGTQLYLKTSGKRLLEGKEGAPLFDALLSQQESQFLVLAGNEDQIHLDNPQDVEVILNKDLKNQISTILSITTEKIDEEANLADLGFDSISLTTLAHQLSNFYQISLTPSIFFAHATVKKLTSYLFTTHKETIENFYQLKTAFIKIKPPKEIQPTQSLNEPIAIIGMSGRFPGARNIEELWQILIEGKETITEIPSDRFDWRDYYGDSANDPQKSNCKWIGAIPGVKEFDHTFFGISPKEAKMLDPRQRLLLQEGWKALEDAGYGKNDFERLKIGVYIGVEQGDYQNLNKEKDSNVTSNHEAILASRLSYFLNLDGPVMAINTSCSSGLVAIHQACNSLRNGECDTALAGGVSLTLSPEVFVAMAQAGMLSEDGKCYTFDQRANGMVPGEAVATVVLKRLSQAIEDKDSIYAVIKASGLNYDGKTNGITAPNGEAQAKLIKSIYEKNHIEPEQIEYIVTHGTATKLGDPVEVNALIDAFNHKGHCALTSTKTNFGHTFAASGVINLITLTLSLYNKKIPKSLNFENGNEYINWKDSPFYVNEKTQGWNKPKRLGAVSAFGMSGTNVHMILENYDQEVTFEKQSSYLFFLSAKTEKSLEAKTKELIDYLENEDDLTSISYTLIEGRQHFEYRKAVVASNKKEAIEKLAVKGKKANKSDKEISIQTTTEEELKKIAELYVEGYTPRWKVNHQKCHVPTYPFERNEFWITDASKNDVKRTDCLIINKHQPLQHKLNGTTHSLAKPTGITLKNFGNENEKLKSITKSEPEPSLIAKEKSLVESKDMLLELAESLSRVLDIEMEELHTNEKFVDLGLDSIIGVEWIRAINKRYGTNISATKVYDYPTLDEFQNFLKVEITKKKGGETVILETLVRDDKVIHVSSLKDRANLSSPIAVSRIIEPQVNGKQSDEILNELVLSLSNALDMNSNDVDINENFLNLGLDSIIGVEWIRSINKKYSVSIPVTKIYDYPTLLDFSKFLVTELSNNKKTLLEMLEDVYSGKLNVDKANQELNLLIT
ncbi:MAG: SDR family NAD(P)-dependent oxidoreductase [Parachlamydiaceae bacterium]|nr:SDR family NAD(P)-dependent oxidoreductase [Parachlamydiaceae bacterium]